MTDSVNENLEPLPPAREPASMNAAAPKAGCWYEE